MEDKLLTTRDENLNLKKNIYQKEQDIKIQNVKLRKLESDLKVAQLKKDPNEQNKLIQLLTNQVQELQNKNSELTKLTSHNSSYNNNYNNRKLSTSSMKSNYNSNSQRPKSASITLQSQTPLSPGFNNYSSNNNTLANIVPVNIANSPNTPDLASQMQRLMSNVANKDEIYSERVPFSALVKQKTQEEVFNFQQKNIDNETLGNLHALSNDNATLLALRTELRDKHASIQQLMHQFEKLRHQLEAERLVQRRALEQCEEYKLTLKERESQIVVMKQTIDNQRLSDTKIVMMQTEIDDLRSSNLQLEQHLHSMISTTKLLDSDEKNRITSVVGHYANNIDVLNNQLLERDKRVESLQEQIAQLNAKVSSMQLDVDAAQAAQQSLNKQLIASNDHARNLETKLSLYSTDSGVDSEELMTALQIVRRKKELGYSDDPMIRANQENELKQRELMRDLQYNSELLLVQKKINEKQSIELQRSKEELSRLRTEIAIIKQASVKPPKRSQEEIQLLKAQGIELREDSDDEGGFNVLKLKKSDQLSITSDSMFSQSNIDFDTDFAPNGRGEIIALYISKSLYDSEALPLRHPHDPNAEPITFVTADFYTFDSTTSRLVGGWTPQYKFLSQFRVNIDDAFLDYLAHDFIQLELWCQRKELSAERVASAQIPLESLLTRTDGVMSGTIDMYQHENEADDNKRTDTIICRLGVLHFKLALLRPIVATAVQYRGSQFQPPSIVSK